MIKRIDTFFVVDFDRCLGNIEGSFAILKEVVHDLGIVDRQIFKSMREEIESNGLTFSALEQITNYYPNVNLDDIEKLYLTRAGLEPENLLESGAKDFITFLKSSNRRFCIMSYGDIRWQTIKIKSSGIGKVPLAIVKKANKSEYIRRWLDPNTGKFKIPKEISSDNIEIVANEVVLVDDKMAAFSNLPKEARGYYVSGSSSSYSVKLPKKLPPRVKQISHIDEIITFESTNL